ncbi:MAG TPA: hypothetical protein VFQ01_02920 [Nocardioides sp.]|nr:hypothetical protein [Nocardioides sp.]
MNDDTPAMSDDSDGRPIDPGAPAPPPAAPAAETARPAYAMPLPAGYPAYGVPPVQQRPRFADQVLGMRSVVAVALACLVIGGLSGWILGHAAARDGDGFGRGPGILQQRSFPNGQNGPAQPFGQGQNGR